MINFVLLFQMMRVLPSQECNVELIADPKSANSVAIKMTYYNYSSFNHSVRQLYRNKSWIF